MVTRSERQVHVKKWKKSGQSKKAYAESAGVKYTTFISWFREGSKKKGEVGRFIKLSGTPMVSEVEVRLPNGVRLYLKGSLSSELLKVLADV